MKKIYLIKSLAPWMVDEMLEFSRHTDFEILFLRKQSNFYIDNIKRFEERNLKVNYLTMEIKNLSLRKIYFIYIFIYYKIFSASNLTRITFLLIFYWLALVPFSSDMVVSVNFISKAIIPFLLLLIVSNLPPSFVYFKYIFKSFSFIIIVSIIFAFLSNVFGIGNASYAKGVEDFVRVGFGDAKLYAQAIAVVVFPFFWFSFKLTKNQKYIIIFLSIAAIIFSLISVRRTTLIILGLGSLLFFYFSGKIYSYMKIGVAILIPVILSLPLWLPIFEERMELRKSTFSAEYDIESEARYQEIFYVFNEGVVNTNITRFFFGEEIFNSQGKYGGGVYGDRKLHIDYINILFSSGIIGLFLYFVFYIVLYRTFINLYRNNQTLPKAQLKNLKGLFLSFFCTSLFISLSGQMYEITFRSMIFIIMGLVLCNLKNKNIKSSNE